MKKLKITILIASLVIVLGVICGCASAYAFSGDNETMAMNTLTAVAPNNVDDTVLRSIVISTVGDVRTIGYEYGESITLPTVTRPGYTFNGWVITPVNTAVPSTMPAENLTAQAHWTINSYTITWNGGGGTFSGYQPTTTTTVEYNVMPTAPTPTRAGFTFAGWSPSLVVATADVTYTAQWSAITKTVTFNSNGGSSVTSQAVNVNTVATLPTEPTREHYTFVGWYSDSELNNVFNFDTIITNDITLFAKWDIDTFDITFNGNGGSWSGGSQGATTSVIISCDYGSMPTVVAPTRIGYTFTGWSPTVVTVTADTTYTAQWSVDNCTIHFNVNGGSAVTSITPTYNTVVSAPTPPIKTGYTFDGWFIDTDCTQAYDWTVAVTNIDPLWLYAKWTINTYQITWDANGGTFDD